MKYMKSKNNFLLVLKRCWYQNRSGIVQSRSYGGSRTRSDRFVAGDILRHWNWLVVVETSIGRENRRRQKRRQSGRATKGRNAFVKYRLVEHWRSCDGRKRQTSQTSTEQSRLHRSGRKSSPQQKNRQTLEVY